jgi:glycosyltransferase involved in cell wall biosynthesis
VTARRVCLVTTFYPPHSFGGDGISIQRIAQGLARRGLDVTVVYDADAYTVLTGDSRRDMPMPPDPAGVKVVALRSRLPLVSTLLTHQLGRPVVNRRRLRAILDDGAFDAVLFNNISLAGGPGVLAYGGDAAKIYLAHENWLVCPTHVLWRHKREPCTGRQCIRCQLRYRRPPQLWRHTGLLDRRLDEVDVFVAFSDFSRAKHREFGFTRDMIVLPPFLPDPGDQTPAAPTARPHERPYFLCVARLERIKGVEDVVDAFRTITTADLVIAGDGPERAALARRAQDNPRVRFEGRVPSGRLDAYYQHAIALIAPSRGFETFGLTLIEAFSHGTPVLARRIGTFSEIIERSGGGILFDSPADLSAAAGALQRAPERRAALGAAGYDAYRRCWSESAAVPQYLVTLNRALEQRRRTRGSCAPS